MSNTTPLGSIGFSHGWTAFGNRNLAVGTTTNTNGSTIPGTCTIASAVQNAVKAAQATPYQPASPLPATPSVCDQHLFTYPDMITGGAILNLASRRSIKEIAEYAKKNVTPAAVARRLARAVHKRAAETGMTIDEACAELNNKKIAIGLVLKTHSFRSPANASVGNKNVSSIPQLITSKNLAEPGHIGGITQPDDDVEMGDAGSQIASAHRLAQQQREDDAAFADPNSLFNEKLLVLAERHSDRQIEVRIAQSHQSVPLTFGGVRTRIRSALRARAQVTGISREQARVDLMIARRRNGIKARTPTVRAPIQSTAAATTYRAEPAPQVDAAVQAQTDGDSEMVDTEATDSDSEGSQEGYDAGEVEAANTLLLFANGDVETQEAAAILMNLHEADAIIITLADHTGDTTEEVSDTEMTEEEQAAFHAKYAASFRLLRRNRL